MPCCAKMAIPVPGNIGQPAGLGGRPHRPRAPGESSAAARRSPSSIASRQLPSTTCYLTTEPSAPLPAAGQCNSEDRKLRHPGRDPGRPARKDKPHSCTYGRRAFTIIYQKVRLTVAAIDHGGPFVPDGLHLDPITEWPRLDASSGVQPDITPDDPHCVNSCGRTQLAGKSWPRVPRGGLPPGAQLVVHGIKTRQIWRSY